MLSLELFISFGILAFVLYFMGLYLVYENHTLALLAPVSSVIIMWGLTLLTAFGRVGSTVHLVVSDAVQSVSVPADPAAAYIMAFLSLGLTVSLLIFVAQFAALKASGEDEEEGV